jgi:hypothetical protein
MDAIPDNSRLHRHPGLAVKAIPGKGRGLVTGEAIGRSTLLEIAPVIPMTSEDGGIQSSVLFDYPFAWDDPPYIEAIALGAISMANHSAAPNARFETDIPAGLIRLYAARDIAAGEEITIDYAIPLWFEEHG